MNDNEVTGRDMPGLEGTKKRILDTAEQLFAERGLEATSIRDITSAAGANLGAVNYHFASKQALILAVLNRHLKPLNERRLELLRRAEQAAGDAPASAEAVLDALIRPLIEGSFAAGEKQTSFIRLMGRSHTESNVEVKNMMRAESQKMIPRFMAALSRALPELPPDELPWLLKFVLGALHHSVHSLTREQSELSPRRKKLNAEELVRKLVTFAAAGMKAFVPVKT